MTPLRGTHNEKNLSLKHKSICQVLQALFFFMYFVNAFIFNQHIPLDELLMQKGALPLTAKQHLKWAKDLRRRNTMTSAVKKAFVWVKLKPFTTTQQAHLKLWAWLNSRNKQKNMHKGFLFFTFDASKTNYNNKV